MVRTPRVEIEGGVYRVAKFVTSGEVVFSGSHEGAELIETIRETKNGCRVSRCHVPRTWEAAW